MAEQTTTVSLDFVVTKYEDGTYSSKLADKIFPSNPYSEAELRNSDGWIAKSVIKAIDSGAFKESFKPVKGMLVSRNGLRDCYDLAVFVGDDVEDEGEWIRAGDSAGWALTSTIERLINEEGWEVIE